MEKKNGGFSVEEARKLCFNIICKHKLRHAIVKEYETKGGSKYVRMVVKIPLLEKKA